MKKVIIILLLSVFLNTALAQTNAIYITGSVSICPDDHMGIFEGFSKVESDLSQFNIKSSKVYYIGNIEKSYEITLLHYIDLDSKYNLTTIDMPITALAEFDKVISVEELMNFKDANTAYNWMLDTLESNVKIYVIDTNDYYKSDPALESPDRMKVIEVRISYQSIPDHILNPL